MTSLNFLGLLLGLGIGGVTLAVSVGITSSKWWHRRQHRKQWHIFSCDHCLNEWRKDKR